MRALLVQESLLEVLEGGFKLNLIMVEKDMKVLLKKTHSMIVLSLSDKVLRQALNEKTLARPWTNLESLHMTKSLGNYLYIEQALYSYKIISEKVVNKEVNEFNKFILDFQNIDINIDNED